MDSKIEKSNNFIIYTVPLVIFIILFIIFGIVIYRKMNIVKDNECNIENDINDYLESKIEDHSKEDVDYLEPVPLNNRLASNNYTKDITVNQLYEIHEYEEVI